MADGELSVSEYLRKIGRKGGQAKSEAKLAAVRANQKKATEAAGYYRRNPSLRQRREPEEAS